MEPLDASSRRAPLDIDGEVKHVGASVACRVHGIESHEDTFRKRWVRGPYKASVVAGTLSGGDPRPLGGFRVVDGDGPFWKMVIDRLVLDYDRTRFGAFAVERAQDPCFGDSGIDQDPGVRFVGG